MLLLYATTSAIINEYMQSILIMNSYLRHQRTGKFLAAVFTNQRFIAATGTRS